MIDINKVVFEVPIAEREMPLSDEKIAKIKGQVIERARKVFGDNQEIDLEVQWRPAPGFYREPVQLAVFFMTKAVDTTTERMEEDEILL